VHPRDHRSRLRHSRQIPSEKMAVEEREFVGDGCFMQRAALLPSAPVCNAAEVIEVSFGRSRRRQRRRWFKVGDTKARSP
jgi:hypothetical protein